MSKQHRSAGALVAIALLVAACGSPEESVTTTESPATTEPPATTGPPAAAETSVFEIHATDYDYPNLPDTLPLGTELRMVNHSSDEAHEAVVVRLPDGEERSVEELLELDDEEADPIFDEGFKGVLVAMPDEEAFGPYGPIVLDEPGRYMIVCFFPIGHDPVELAAAMDDPDAEGPPDLGDGPPHFTGGMVADVIVEG